MPLLSSSAGLTGSPITPFTLRTPSVCLTAGPGSPDPVCTSVLSRVLQKLGKKAPCVLAHAALYSFSFSWILACLLPQEKKRSRMFGKICRSVEHFLHWCKRREGSGGGEGEAQRCSEGASWPQPPTCSPRVTRGHLAGSCRSLTHFPDQLSSPQRRRGLFLPSNRCCLPRTAFCLTSQDPSSHLVSPHPPTSPVA